MESEISQSETFVVVDAYLPYSDGQVTTAVVETVSNVAIINHHGKPLTAEKDGSVSWNRSWIREWEIFKMMKLENDKVALKSFHGQYLSAQPNGTLQCNRVARSGWEMFEIVPVKDGTALKTYHGYYVCVNAHGLCEARDVVREWETFLIQTEY
jgi:hypothetical protein